MRLLYMKKNMNREGSFGLVNFPFSFF